MRNAEFGIIYIPLVCNENRKDGFFTRPLQALHFRHFFVPNFVRNFWHINNFTNKTALFSFKKSLGQIQETKIIPIFKTAPTKMVFCREFTEQK